MDKTKLPKMTQEAKAPVDTAGLFGRGSPDSDSSATVKNTVMDFANGDFVVPPKDKQPMTAPPLVHGSPKTDTTAQNKSSVGTLPPLGSSANSVPMSGRSSFEGLAPALGATVETAHQYPQQRPQGVRGGTIFVRSENDRYGNTIVNETFSSNGFREEERDAEEYEEHGDDDDSKSNNGDKADKSREVAADPFGARSRSGRLKSPGKLRPLRELSASEGKLSSNSKTVLGAIPKTNAAAKPAAEEFGFGDAGAVNNNSAKSVRASFSGEDNADQNDFALGTSALFGNKSTSDDDQGFDGKIGYQQDKNSGDYVSRSVHQQALLASQEQAQQAQQELQQRYDQDLRELEVLRSKFEEVSAKVSASEAEASRYKGIAEAGDAEVASHSERALKAEKDFNAQQREAREARAKNEALQEELRQLTAQLDDVSVKMREQDQKLESSAKMLREKEGDLEFANTQAKEAVAAQKAAEEELKRVGGLAQEAEQLLQEREAIDAERSALDVDRRQLSAEIEARLGGLSQQKRQLQDRLSEIEEQEKLLAAKERELEAKEREAEERELLQSSKVAAQYVVAQEDVTALRAESDRLREALDAAGVEKTSLSSQLSALRESGTKATDDRIAKIQQDYAKDLELINAQLRDRESKIEKALELQRKALAEAAAAKGEAAAAKGEVEDLRNTNSDLLGRLSGLQGEIDGLKEGEKELQDKLDGAEEDLRKKDGQIKEKDQELADAAKEAEKQREKSDDALADAKRDAEQAKSDADVAKRERDAANKERDEAKEGARRANLGRDHAVDIATEAKERADQADEDKAKAEEDKRKAEEDKAKAEEDKRKAERERDDAKADADAAKKRADEILADAEEDSRTHDLILANLQKENGVLRARVIELEQENQLLKKADLERADRIKATLKTIEELAAKQKEMQEETETLKAKLAELEKRPQRTTVDVGVQGVNPQTNAGAQTSVETHEMAIGDGAPSTSDSRIGTDPLQSFDKGDQTDEDTRDADLKDLRAQLESAQKKLQALTEEKAEVDAELKEERVARAEFEEERAVLDESKKIIAQLERENNSLQRRLESGEKTAALMIQRYYRRYKERKPFKFDKSLVKDELSGESDEISAKSDVVGKAIKKSTMPAATKPAIPAVVSAAAEDDDDDVVNSDDIVTVEDDAISGAAPAKKDDKATSVEVPSVAAPKSILKPAKPLSPEDTIKFDQALDIAVKTIFARQIADQGKKIRYGGFVTVGEDFKMEAGENHVLKNLLAAVRKVAHYAKKDQKSATGDGSDVGIDPENLSNLWEDFTGVKSGKNAGKGAILTLPEKTIFLAFFNAFDNPNAEENSKKFGHLKADRKSSEMLEYFSEAINKMVEFEPEQIGDWINKNWISKKVKPEIDFGVDKVDVVGARPKTARIAISAEPASKSIAALCKEKDWGELQDGVRVDDGIDVRPNSAASVRKPTSKSVVLISDVDVERKADDGLDSGRSTPVLGGWGATH